MSGQNDSRFSEPTVLAVREVKMPEGDIVPSAGYGSVYTDLLARHVPLVNADGRQTPALFLRIMKSAKDTAHFFSLAAELPTDARRVWQLANFAAEKAVGKFNAKAVPGAVYRDAFITQVVKELKGEGVDG